VDPGLPTGGLGEDAGPGPWGLVSIIIPALNEAPAIGDTLASLARQAPPWEVIVADGGSEDGTPGVVAEDMPEASVIAPGRGRARQMNAGAAVATGDILLFLHADTRLPEGALAAVRAALADPAAAGGCFRTAFDLGAAPTGAEAFGPAGRAFMRLWEARLWMQWHRFAFGDRALFARRPAFDAVGGFPRQPIFEDLDFVRSLRRHGRFLFLDAEVTTSARRYRRHGALRQQLRNLGLWTAWNAGVPPRRLKPFYSDHDRG